GKVRPIDRGAAAPPASEEWRIRSEARGLNPAAGRDAGPRRASSSVPSNGSCPCPEHSDVPMAQFIVNLNASMPPSERFIVHMLDPTNMFVQPHVAHMIRSKIGEFRDQNSYEKPQ
uniref:General transcription and DNA repair factor IIH subunit TFB5 n=1 Tax=Zea mays TaxID=4577 RepID=A0A804PSR8_MAIZE